MKMEIGNEKFFYASIDDDKRLFFRMNNTITGIIVVILRMMGTIIGLSFFVSAMTQNLWWTVAVFTIRDGLAEIHRRTEIM